MREIAGASVSVDSDATRDAYARITRGGADTCNCLPCRNYRLVRDIAYPTEFRSLLDELGVDYRKELEVYFGVPQPDGLHHYEGWFCFAGKVYGRDITPELETSPFSYRIDDSAPEPQPEFAGMSVVTLWFATAVPWRLDEPWTVEGTVISSLQMRPF